MVSAGEARTVLIERLASPVSGWEPGQARRWLCTYCETLLTPSLPLTYWTSPPALAPLLAKHLLVHTVVLSDDHQYNSSSSLFEKELLASLSQESWLVLLASLVMIDGDKTSVCILSNQETGKTVSTFNQQIIWNKWHDHLSFSD